MGETRVSPIPLLDKLDGNSQHGPTVSSFSRFSNLRLSRRKTRIASARKTRDRSSTISGCGNATTYCPKSCSIRGTIYPGIQLVNFHLDHCSWRIAAEGRERGFDEFYLASVDPNVRTKLLVSLRKVPTATPVDSRVPRSSSVFQIDRCRSGKEQSIRGNETRSRYR